MHSLTLLGAVLQDEFPGAGLLFGAGLMFFLFLGVVLYAYTAICFMKIAEKTNTENGWWAWIPILNILLMLAIARKPLWWILLMLIPLVNLVIAIIVLVGICQARGKSGWLVIGFLVPLVNLIVLGYLAFGD
jgi:hypothetical protein